jgi:colanic acid biosynthesis glycosyl transferase WcaI
MRILILGLNHAPEPIGIGPYTAGMAAWLAARGHEIEVVTAKPYYPAWAIDPAFRRPLFADTVEAGVRLLRVPLYVPARPSGLRRVIHHLSFAAMAAVPLLRAARRRRPQIVLTIAPSMIAAPLARWAARLAGGRSWLHIQDFEVGAAFATGLLDPHSLPGRLANRFERSAYGGFDRYSSISPQMCARLVALGIDAERVLEIRNWADSGAGDAGGTASGYRREWGITTPHVGLYSGNISNKQGIGIIVEVARRLRHRTDLGFVICGDGPEKARLIEAGKDCPNIQFRDLQPRERLHDLMALATVHLLPQRGAAADLVLPSKLTNMLASGRPVVATAEAGTGLAQEVVGCGLVVPPDDAAAFAQAIETLLDDEALYRDASTRARTAAAERWSKAAILGRLEAELLRLVGESGSDGRVR